MSGNKQILLAGGFLEMIELCEAAAQTIAGVFDPALHGLFHRYHVLGDDADAKRLFPKYRHCGVVLCVDSPSRREVLWEYYSGIGYRVTSISHPLAIVSRSAVVGEACIIQHGVNVSSEARLGHGVKLNVRANIMHEVVLEDFCTVAPNAVLLGRVKVGRGAYIGANATVLPGITIGKGAVVGAGAVVTRDVAPDSTVAGSPAKPLRGNSGTSQ